MSEHDDGGPAFPDRDRVDPAPIMGEGWSMVTPQKGMSLRDYFAAQSITSAMLACEQVAEKESEEAKWAAIGIICYRVADAMLKARKA